MEPITRRSTAYLQRMSCLGQLSEMDQPTSPVRRSTAFNVASVPLSEQREIEQQCHLYDVQPPSKQAAKVLRSLESKVTAKTQEESESEFGDSDDAEEEVKVQVKIPTKMGASSNA